MSMGSNELLSNKSYPVSMKFMGSPEFNGHNNSTCFIRACCAMALEETRREEDEMVFSKGNVNLGYESIFSCKFYKIPLC